MGSNEARANFWDTLFILAVAAFLDLALLWAAYTLLGRTAFTEVPGFIEGAVSSVWKWATGGAAAAALLAWIVNKDKEERPNYLIWIIGTAAGLLVTVVLLGLVLGRVFPPPPTTRSSVAEGQPQPPALVPIDLRLRLLGESEQKDNGAALYNISWSEGEKRGAESLAKLADVMHDDLYVQHIALYRPAIRYHAAYAASIPAGTAGAHVTHGPYRELCFRGALDGASGEDRHVTVECNAGVCSFAQEDPGPRWIEFESCKPPQTGSWLLDFLPVQSAYAMDQESGAANNDEGWSVPLLADLKRNGSPTGGYTEFTIHARGPAIAASDYVRYSITANKLKIYENGLPSGAYWIPRDQEGGATVSFALENLAFVGDATGCDDISVTVEPLRKDGTPLGPSFRLSREYAALRDGAKIELVGEGASFSWDAGYRVTDKQRVNELSLLSLPKIETLNEKRIQINEALSGERFNGQSVAAVLRPARGEHDPGIVLGVVNDKTKQIRFTFDQDTYSALKKWFLEKRAHNKNLRAASDPIPGLYTALGTEDPKPTACLKRDIKQLAAGNK